MRRLLGGSSLHPWIIDESLVNVTYHVWRSQTFCWHGLFFQVSSWGVDADVGMCVALHDVSSASGGSLRGILENFWPEGQGFEPQRKRALLAKSNFSLASAGWKVLEQAKPLDLHTHRCN